MDNFHLKLWLLLAMTDRVIANLGLVPFRTSEQSPNRETEILLQCHCIVKIRSHHNKSKFIAKSQPEGRIRG